MVCKKNMFDFLELSVYTLYISKRYQLLRLIGILYVYFVFDHYYRLWYYSSPEALPQITSQRLILQNNHRLRLFNNLLIYTKLFQIAMKNTTFDILLQISHVTRLQIIRINIELQEIVKYFSFKEYRKTTEVKRVNKNQPS